MSFRFDNAKARFSRPPEATDKDRQVLGSILEGACPNGHGPLERRDDGQGWCSTCNLGWSANWNGTDGEVRMSFEVDTSAFDRLRPPPPAQEETKP